MWHHDGTHCWHLTPLQSSARSHVLIVINHPCCSLQCDIKLLTFASSVTAVFDILYHRHFGAFTIIVVDPTINIKKLVVAWHNLAFPSCNQPCCAIPWHKNDIILVITSCNTSMLLWSLQLTANKNLIVAWETFHHHTLAIVLTSCNVQIFVFAHSLTMQHSLPCNTT